MSKSLYKLKDMICDEIDTIAEQGELTPGSLETVDKLTHSLKSIESVLAMKDSGYSNDYYDTNRDRHYGDDYRSSRYGRRYSRDGLKERLRSMVDDASTEKERSALKECIAKMEG